MRGGHEMVTVGSDVYALGGWDNADFLSVVDVYDTRAGAWRQGKDMKTKHAYFSAALLDGDLYAMSGMSDRKASSQRRSKKWGRGSGHRGMYMPCWV